MAKILELFNNRHNEGKMYQGSAVNAAHGVDRIREAGGGHPLQYVYPGAGGVSVKDDIVLGEGSASHLRDTDRILKFERTAVGARFLDRQIELQRSNPWAQTRQYRKDNITDHTDPTTHKQRHGTDLSVSSALSSTFELPFLGTIQAGIPGDFAIQLNSGKLQEETVTNLISSSGPVYYRLNSKEGMLHTGNLSLLDMVSATVRRTISNKINDLLSPITSFISDVRSRISDTTAAHRPESEYNYLEKIYNQNRGLSDEYGNKHGHLYLGLEKGEDTGTYRHFQQVESRDGSGFVKQFLPSLSDISLFRTIKRFKVDIDDIVDKVVGGDSALKQIEFGPTNLRTRWLKDLSNVGPVVGISPAVEHNRSAADNQIEDSATGKLKSYITELSKYKGEDNKYISIGVDTEGNTVRISSRRDGFKGATQHLEGMEARKRYYKDLMQLNGIGPGKIFRDKKSPWDSDSIDVILQVQGKEDEEVRFRAFIEDISENVTPTYNESKYIGRYETFYTYDKVTRDVSFKLKLQSFSEDETDIIMKKLAYLTSLAYPESSGGSEPGYLTPLITNLTIGKLYRKQPCLVQSLSYSIDTDTSWNIDKQLPMAIQVTMQVRLLDKKLYTYEGMKLGDHPFNLYLKDVHELIDDDIDRRTGSGGDLEELGRSPLETMGSVNT